MKPERWNKSASAAAHRSRVRRLGALALAALSASACLTNRVLYVGPGPEEPHAVLRLENTIAIGMDLTAGLDPNMWLHFILDRRQVTEYRWLSEGVTELRLPPGLHELYYWGELSNVHRSDPVKMVFTAKAGRVYSIVFRWGDDRFVSVFRASYEGFDELDRAGWPEELDIRFQGVDEIFFSDLNPWMSVEEQQDT